MNKLVDRYIYDVVRRLPEKERDEVGRELLSNIQDMLPEGADEDAAAAVLNEMGSPALLAERYRQNPRYLISPAMFDEYLKTLKLVLPLVGGILLVVGMVLGGIDAIEGGMADAGAIVGGVVGGGISMAVSAAIQALVWVTVGFAIADRVGKKSGGAEQWSVKDLPDEIPLPKQTIPLSDCIVEMTVVVFFSFLGLLFCLDVIPISIYLNGEGLHLRQLFGEDALRAFVPVIIISGVMNTCVNMAKLVVRRWTPPVCGLSVISNVVDMGMVLYLCLRFDVFGADFSAFSRIEDWSWMTTPGDIGMPIMMIIAMGIIMGSLIEMGMTLYRGVRFAVKDT